MLMEDEQIEQGLRRIVARFPGDASLREDLMQEALVHLWQMEIRCPGQARSWYLQGCRYHLQNLMRQGRSVDSRKRAWAQPLGLAAGAHDECLAEMPDTSGHFWEEVSARDIVAALGQRLTEAEREALLCLTDGLSAREIAGRLKRSHTLVNRWRRKIASLAIQLGLRSAAPAPRRALAGSA